MTSSAALDDLAQRLLAARIAGQPIEPLTSHADLTLDDAYRLQLLGLRLLADRGDPLAGVKLGFTSAEKAARFGVTDVIIGGLTASMQVADGGALSLGALIAPRIEPEVALLLSAESGRVDLRDDAVDLLSHVTHIAPAMEIIDSRFRGVSFSPGNLSYRVEDGIADNASGARFVVGPWADITAVRSGRDLADLPVTLAVNGATVASGSTRAILGNPLAAAAHVRRLAGRYGHALPPSAIVLAGSATSSAPLEPDSTIVTAIDGLGRVSIETVA